MKTLFVIASVFISIIGFSQTEKAPCSGLPMAKPSVKATISTDEVVKSFETKLSEKLKKGTHSVVYKVFVDCNGTVTQATYQSGTFSETDQKEYETRILELVWKPAMHKDKTVNSIAFISMEIVNGKISVTVQ